MKRPEIEAWVELAQQTRTAYLSAVPADLQWRDDGAMAIAFDDGAAGDFSPEVLRAICPCAECRGTHGAPPKAVFTVLSPAKLSGAARQTVVAGVEPIGNYAMAITWGDGHKDGLYSWAYLRALIATKPE